MKKRTSEGNTSLKRKFGFTLSDICLLVFMALLLAQTAYAMFLPADMSANTLDAAFRTFSASVFGYFLSGKFMDTGVRTTVVSGSDYLPESSSGTSAVRAGLGFGAPLRSGTLGAILPVASVGKGRQIAVGAIGVICLILMIVVRNTVGITAGNTAAVSQFRDFASTSLGYLIGSGREEV